MMEMSIVVIIISIIAAITIPAYQKTVTENEKRTKGLKHSRTFAKNRTEKAKKGKYPPGVLITRLDKKGKVITTDMILQPDYVPDVKTK